MRRYATTRYKLLASSLLRQFPKSCQTAVIILNKDAAIRRRARGPQYYDPI